MCRTSESNFPFAPSYGLVEILMGSPLSLLNAVVDAFYFLLCKVLSSLSVFVEIRPRSLFLFFLNESLV